MTEALIEHSYAHKIGGFVCEGVVLVQLADETKQDVKRIASQVYAK